MKLEKINNIGGSNINSCECSGSSGCAGGCSNSSGADAQNLKKKRAGQGNTSK